MIKEAIYDVINGKNLDLATAKQAMCEIMEGKATNAQIGGFLTALRLKGETIDEITAFAQAMREKCSVVKHDRDVFEIVGTGGDEANTGRFRHSFSRSTGGKTRQPQRIE